MRRLTDWPEVVNFTAMQRPVSPAIFIAALLASACAGVLVTLQITYKPSEPRNEVRYSPDPFYDPMPELMLYPDGTTLETLYPDAGFLSAVRAPETISIHLIGGDQKIVLGEHRFSSQGGTPTKETEIRLIRALCSISSYEPPGKLCIFDPAALLRLTKGGVQYDMMFCFHCRQIESDGGADMSARGVETFLKCFCDTLPDFKDLHEFRRISTLRRNGTTVLDLP